MLPADSVVKNLPAIQGDMGLTPNVEDDLEKAMITPLVYFGSLGNPMDGAL